MDQIVATLLQGEPAHMAILGPGGMGKTTLAIAALHHPEIVSKYGRRHFISCESVFEHSQLINAIGAHLGLEPSKELCKAVIEHFSECGPALMVLDNLETPWEQAECRAEVEDLLSLLGNLPTLALLVGPCPLYLGRR